MHRVTRGSAAEIWAFKIQARLKHPDLGGNPADFVALNQARERALRSIGARTARVS